MLKKEIKYTDFNGNETSDVFYFNISKPELLELEVSTKEGMKALIERIVEEKDNHKLVELFKKIILLAYGQKSEDGKRFIKSKELCDEFEQTAAYQELFIELATTDGNAVEFLTGILPKDLVTHATLEGMNQTQSGLASAPQS